MQFQNFRNVSASLLFTFASLCIPGHAQTYSESVVHSFCSQGGSACTDGEQPLGGLTQAADGNYYGATSLGGANSEGTVFKVTPSGVVTTLYSFCSQSNADYNCLDGAAPNPYIIQGPDGALYGTTRNGGVSSNCDGGLVGDEEIGCGTFFRLTLLGKLSTLYNFCSQMDCTDGSNPTTNLILSSDGNFYGTADVGGANQDGLVFRVSPGGAFYPFYSFANAGDGAEPTETLIQGTDGNYYGTAFGEPGSNGTVFQLTLSETATTLYSFCSQAHCADGAAPYGGLVEGSDGSFYGTTREGGATTTCSSGSGCGTVFNITSTGTLKSLYSFCSQTDCSDGYDPLSVLWLGTDGLFYGTAAEGGANSNCDGYGCGTAFRITSSGAFATIYSFCTQTNCADGSTPYAGLLQESDGTFGGTTADGGAQGGGTVYEIAPSSGLAAPVQLSLSSSSISLGQSVTLTWKVLNAFSDTMQQCYAFVQNSLTGAGAWTGLQQGSLTNNVYQGGTTLTPTEPGSYTYALTCGGIESGFGSLEVTGQAATTTSLTSNSPVTIGNVAMMTATTKSVASNGPITGSITFSVGSVTLGTVALSNGTASLNLTAQNIPAGIYYVTATYSGNSNYQSSSGTGEVEISKYITSASLTATPASLTQGQAESLSVAVARTNGSGTPTGSVAFYAGSLFLGSSRLGNGVATLAETTNGSIPPGTYSVFAVYSGDTTDQSATSSDVNVTLLAATQTSLTVSPSPIPSDSSFTLTAQVKQRYDSAVPTGTVAFSVGSNSLGSATLSDAGQAVLNASDFGIAKGTYAVTATYSGDASNAASSATVNVAVE